MTLLSRYVPQADNLSDIARTVDAVAAGETDFQGIAERIGKVERQGRYYRAAAESMGLLANARNHAILTPLGEALAHSSGSERSRLLGQAVLQNPVVREVLIHADNAGAAGISKSQLATIIEATTTASGSTPERRSSTVWSWLIDSGFATEHEGRLFSQSLPGSVYIQTSDDLGLSIPPVTEYNQGNAGGSTPSRPDYLSYSVDQAKLERANLAHSELVDLMANKIRAVGAIPRSNRFVDLATELDDRVYLFEMKSATASSYHERVRHGISQLYEYAYIHQLQTPVLCLVSEIQPPKRKQWMTDYLVDSLGIQTCWRSSGNRFRCPPQCASSIGMLM